MKKKEKENLGVKVILRIILIILLFYFNDFEI